MLPTGAFDQISCIAQAIPTNDKTARTITTAPTSQTMLFMFFPPVLMGSNVCPMGPIRSGQTDKVQDRDHDDNSSHEPNDAVHFPKLPFVSLHQRHASQMVPQRKGERSGRQPVRKTRSSSFPYLALTSPFQNLRQGTQKRRAVHMPLQHMGGNGKNRHCRQPLDKLHGFRRRSRGRRAYIV